MAQRKRLSADEFTMGTTMSTQYRELGFAKDIKGSLKPWLY
jgi:hypothetical protein